MSNKRTNACYDQLPPLAYEGDQPMLGHRLVFRSRAVVLRTLTLLGFLNAGVHQSIHAQDNEFDPLLTRVPVSANAIVCLNVQQVFASPIAKAQNWQQTYREDFAASPLIVPPGAQRYLLAADFDLVTMRPRWQVGAIEMIRDHNITDIKLATQGKMDQFGEVEAIWPAPHVCLAKFAPRQFGLIFPADRQMVSHWIDRATQSDSGPWSPYLRYAADATVREELQITMAIDLADVLHPEQVRRAVQNSTVLSEVDESEATRVLASVQGLTIQIRTQEKIEAKLSIDFSYKTDVFQRVAKSLVLHLLKSSGAMIEDFENWSVRTHENQIVLSGNLSTTGMRQLFSLVALDTSIIAASEAGAAEQVQKDAVKRTNATRRYFQAIMDHLDDLQRPQANGTLWTTTLWLEMYARKIERMPVGLVDPEVAAFGQYVAESFRYMIDTLQYAQVGQSQGIRPPVPERRIAFVPTDNVNQFGAFRFREYVPVFGLQYDSEKMERNLEARRKMLLDAERSASSLLDEIRREAATLTVSDTD